ncbi:DNA-binding protein [Candidatus Sumerlaeota bacterium]|nr:DNA-binding protein [Candidatus Sumerlaeota bacterium]
MSKSLSIRLADDLAGRLATMASETERSKAFHVQKALEAYLDEYADLQIALDRLHDQTDPIVSGKELRKSVGL